MTETTPRPLWRGRVAAILGILLIALNLRTAVAALSPIIPHIQADIPLDAVGLGIVGALPPIAFAVSGLTAPLLARRIGLETSLVLACVAMIVGPVIRAFSGSYLALVVGSVIALAGMGFGNILLPPAVKKYFPDRIGVVTTAYVTLLSISASVPAIIAEPIAGVGGWRVSVGLWAVLAFTALVPWVLVQVRHIGDKRRDADAGVVVEAPPQLLGRMWHSRVAWAIAAVFAVSSLNAYAMFAWLPTLLVDVAGATPTAAGALLALFALMGLPAGLVIPLLATRMRNVGWLIQLGVACFLLGYAGLLLAPSAATWLWVSLIGLGPLVFPLCLVLINLRTRSPHASAALSGFVQSIGYGIGALGPLLVAVVHDVSGTWTVPIVLLMVTTLGAAAAGLTLRKPLHVEDELARRNPATD